MQSTSIKGIIIPLSDYTTVNEDASLYDAVAELEKTRQKFKDQLYTHYSVIVLNDKNEVIGRLTQLDALKALEPKYLKIGVSPLSRHGGLSQLHIDSMADAYNLFEEPLDHLCQKASELKVKDFIEPPAETDFIDEEATLNEAIHQFIMGNQHYQTILVRRGEEVIGVLRVHEVFHEISSRIRECKI